jgi:FkbM family methyltransferase
VIDGGTRLVCRDGVSFRVSAGSHDAFWDRYESGAWEPRTLALLERFAGRGARLLDVGAWIGPTTLHAAARGAHVLAFEPDPMAFAELSANLALNPGLAARVTAEEAALWTTDGKLTLFARQWGDSETSVLPEIERKGAHRRLGESVIVLARAARDVFARFASAGGGLVKIDVEGAEYEIVPDAAPALAGHDVALLVSLHPQNIGADRADPAERHALRAARSTALFAAMAGFSPRRPGCDAAIEAHDGVVSGDVLFVPAPEHD